MRDLSVYFSTHELPDYFNPKKLTPVYLNALVHWDETHKKPKYGRKTGKGKGRGTQTRYPRDADGAPDPNGTLAKRETQKQVKYDHESRFCLGAAVNTNAAGTSVGARPPYFEYSAQQIETVSDMTTIKRLPLRFEE